MTLTVNMEPIGFKSLQPEEMLLYNGGETDLKLPKWVKFLGPLGLLSFANENWDDIKKGFVDGWNLK